MKIRVYYEDTDWGGVVYYANYLRYMERSRTEYLRERGVDLLTLHHKGFLFAVIEAHIKYHKPARYNDMLDVHSTLAESSSVSLTIHTTIHNQHHDHLVTGMVKLACISNEGKARRIPAEVLEAVGKET